MCGGDALSSLIVDMQILVLRNMGQGIGIPVCPDSLRRRRHGGILLAEWACRGKNIAFTPDPPAKAIEQRINPRGSRNLMLALVTVTAN